MTRISEYGTRDLERVDIALRLEFRAFSHVRIVDRWLPSSTVPFVKRVTGY